MNAPLSRREFLKSGGALVIALGVPGLSSAQIVKGADAALGKTLDVSELDGFIAVHADSTVTVYCGKVDLGQGLRIAIPQMAAEELGLDVGRIHLVEGDTALTPDQGPTAGSTGTMRGGVQIRQAAATARDALIALAAARSGTPAADLEAAGGAVRPKAGGAGIPIGELIGERRFQLKLDAKARLKDASAYTVVGKSLPRPDVPAKIAGRHRFVHDLVVEGMLHARVIRPHAVGARLLSVDARSIQTIPNARVVQIGDFLGVVAPDEWDAVTAAQQLKVAWSNETALLGSGGVRDWLKRGPFEAEQLLVNKGDARAALAKAERKVSGEYYWPVQTHGSMGPSCAVADVRKDRATIWTASQATHRYRLAYARMLDMPAPNVRLIYMDGSGCYGMNGHDDAAADAALLSRAVGAPVRVQWMRADEHAWDPKGPPQLISIQAALGADNRIDAWAAEMWVPRATAKLPSVPLLGPQAAGIAQPAGQSVGLISQNADPPYAAPHQSVYVHWHATAPLRPSNIRAPGKVANSFAVESITDELAVLAKQDAVEFRLQGLSDPRGIEVLKRVAKLIGWQPRVAPARTGVGRGVAYVHYKHNETYVAIAMEAAVNAKTGAIRVQRVACAHDCGMMVNPDAVRAQVEGCILQTLSRTLLEEIMFDRTGVTSLDWRSYPILAFPEVPEIRIDLIDRPREPILGAGEAAAAAVPAALANAVFDAVGIRLRTVPFVPKQVLSLMA